MRTLKIIGQFVGCYAVGCLVIGIALGEIAFHPGREPVDSRRSAAAKVVRFGAVLEDVSIFASDGAELRGWFAQPERANGDAVILLHGIGGNRQGMMQYTAGFLSRGYAVLLPDSRGHGASGGFPTYGVKESADVRHWFDWLMRRQNPKCVFGLGESMGAAIVLQSVKTTPFCAVVAESSFANFRQAAYIRVGRVSHTGPWLDRTALYPAFEGAFLYGRATRGVDLTLASPEAAVAASTVPILLIHGLDDRRIPPSQSEQIRARNPKDVSLWEVPGAGHCGALRTAPQEFDARVFDWLRANDRIQRND